MHLTGRNLVLALAGCVVCGAALGVVTSIASATQPPRSSNASASPSPTDLGDETASYPLPSDDPVMPQAAVSIAPLPSPSLSPSSPSPTVSATPSPSRSTGTQARHAAQEPTGTVKPDSRATLGALLGTPMRQMSSPGAAPSTPSAGRPAAPTTPADRRTAPENGWRAPTLQVGSNDLAVPHLTSGADVGMVIACSPSSACTMNDAILEIGASATSVSVTWSAGKRGGYRGWVATADLASSTN
jgi:hypothetical protein